MAKAARRANLLRERLGGSTDRRPRGNANARGYGRQWRAARLAFLQSHPCCRECEKAGRIRGASVVDHIRPHRGDSKLFWDRGNWQGLCGPCHTIKTAAGL